jgi:hypothetical protein
MSANVSGPTPISRRWSDSDGHWILLADGYHVDGSHAIHEPTKRAADRRLRDVQQCKCADCEAALDRERMHKGALIERVAVLEAALVKALSIMNALMHDERPATLDLGVAIYDANAALAARGTR